ncbi:MAG: nitroreductase family protein [Oscillospiraceae bacterium]|nr:nitroreductase family protein [Oscillospiraceae bacterium]
MDFFELAKSRYSVRSFKDMPIEEEKLQMILEAGRFAPTAKNCQPQRIYVAKSEESRKKLASVCSCTFDAPLILVVCYDRERECKRSLTPGTQTGEMDTSIVCTHMMLQAWDLGIGSCWVGYYNDDEVAAVLGLPEHIRVAALLPMGYPADDAKPLNCHFQSRELSDMVEEI